MQVVWFVLQMLTEFVICFFDETFGLLLLLILYTNSACFAQTNWNSKVQKQNNIVHLKLLSSKTSVAHFQ